MSSMYSSLEDERPRKKPRKGTHSCLECKRRKVRCVFPSDAHSVCVECTARGHACIGQEYEVGSEDPRRRRQDVRDRVARLEALVESLTQKIAAHGAGDVTASQILHDIAVDLLTPSDTSSDSSIERAGQFDNAPLLSLFDNDILQRREDNDMGSPAAIQESPLIDPVSSVPIHSPAKKLPSRYQKISQELLANLPSREVIKAIFDETQDWWYIWKDLAPFLWGGYTTGSIYEHVMEAVATGHPTSIAYVLISMAVCLQQLPAYTDQSRLNLPLPIEDLMRQYTAAVHRLVTSNDELIGNIEGLQCLILQCKFHIDLGQPRRAWLLIRRAVSLAQLMGIHRAPRPPKNDSERARANLRRSLWWVIFQSERYLSLILGLPYCTVEGLSNLDVDESVEGWAASPERYRRKLAVISGAVSELNQAPAISPLAVAEIDQRLDDLARSVPDGWWEPELHKVQLDVSEVHSRLTSQFWHHQIKSLVHLRPALRAATEPRYEYNRSVCIASSKEMINRYFLLRTSAGTARYLCKVIDFQAFTATVLILLNLLGYGTGPLAKAGQLDPDEEEKDWKMVDDMIELMRLASNEVGSVVARQALKVLERLRQGRNRASDIWEGNTVKLVIPYFGTICIGQGSHLRRGPPEGGSNPQTNSAPPTNVGRGPDAQGTNNVQPRFLYDDPLATQDDGIISFSSLLALAPGGSDQTSQSQHGGADSMFADSIGFDLDQDWSWFMNGGTLFQ